jgi:hypothetical protein
MMKNANDTKCVAGALRLLRDLTATCASYELRHGNHAGAVQTLHDGYMTDCRLRTEHGLDPDPYCYASPDLACLVGPDGWPLTPVPGTVPQADGPAAENPEARP